MIDQLPRWVWVAGGLMSFSAGLMNAVGLLAFGHEAVTHLTGTTTLITGALGAAQWFKALHLLSILLAFCLGAIFSGWLIGDEQLKLGRRYGIALWIETALILLSVWGFSDQQHFAYYLLAAAVGLQNAMASTYSGAVLRTSHVTGMFTDLSIYIGHWLRGLPFNRRRIAISSLIISGFFAGGLVGAIGMGFINTHVLLLAALICAVMALSHGVYRQRHRHLDPLAK